MASQVLDVFLSKVCGQMLLRACAQVRLILACTLHANDLHKHAHANPPPLPTHTHFQVSVVHSCILSTLVSQAMSISKLLFGNRL